MANHCQPWSTIGYGQTWPTMANHGLGQPWIRPTMAIYGYGQPWQTMANHCLPWPLPTMANHVQPLAMANYGQPWPTMANHGQPCLTILNDQKTSQFNLTKYLINSV